MVVLFVYEVKLSPSTTDLNKLKTLCDALGFKNFQVISRRYSQILKVLYGFQL
jgi:hypothetical protein